MPIQSKMDRSQLQFIALDQLVDPESIVRIIDLFCQCIDYDNLSFTVKGKSHEGQPAYETSTLIGIYIYGYLHKVRSCRLLEKACKVNAELWWLTGMQKPSYKTLANFRKDNADAFNNLFKSFSKFCLDLELFGRTTIAIDGSKFRALNSKKNNYNLKKINQHLDYIARQKEDYLKTLDQQDSDDNKLKDLQARTDKYQALKDQLEQSKEKQISTTDPDARALPIRMSIVEVAYNLQSVVDDKHNLIVDYEITNKSDFSTLAPLALQAKNTLEISDQETLTVLADKGYYSAEQIAKCYDHNIETLVAPKSKGSKSKDPRVSKAAFTFDKPTDSYTCPKGIKLHRQGKIYHRHDGIPFKRYVGHWTDCKQCPWVDICVSPGSQKAARGRMLNRSIYEDQMDRNDEQVSARKTEYRRRQAIVEHPFGTLKRQWGFTHTSMKGLNKVNGEFGLILLCYNLRRLITILGISGLSKALKSINSTLLAPLATMMHLISVIIFSRQQNSPAFS